MRLEQVGRAYQEVDYEAEFDIHDSDRFVSALASTKWSCEADDDNSNFCSFEVNVDEPDDVETKNTLKKL